MQAIFVAAGIVGLLSVAGDAVAQGCTTLRYTFQPDCFRSSLTGPCENRIERLDLGPQIAVWLERADGMTYVQTMMVTNMTAARGLGNRPGIPDFLSSPKFPYGKRRMALPVWAHTRNVTYPSVVIQDDREDWLGWHESISTEDPYYCRPMRSDEINVDAISCPTKTFNSAKGKIDPLAEPSYYPPRNDLDVSRLTWKDCDSPIPPGNSCPSMSAERFADLNDLDAVAAATPVYGQVYTGLWSVPADLKSGDYVVMVEVSKEFDTNFHHQYPSIADPMLKDYGLLNNFGQPSVVYRVPIRIDAVPREGRTTLITGYGDWRGLGAQIHPRDATISSDPGSGEGRLLEIAGAGGSGRIHVATEGCAPGMCDPPPASPNEVASLAIAAEELEPTAATIRFVHADDGGAAVVSYDIRYRASETASMTIEEFTQATTVAQVAPSDPGSPGEVRVTGLKPQTQYAVGIRAKGRCGSDSDLAVIVFETPDIRFARLSGCFIATAAYGSALQPAVGALRAARDLAERRSVLAAIAVDLYYRASPPVAGVLARSDAARAVIRSILAPIAALLGGEAGRPGALLGQRTGQFGDPSPPQ